MEDYASNSKKSKAAGEQPEKKKVERVTTGEVLLKKKGLGGKFRDFFIATDLRSVVTYIVWDVALPSMKSMIVDSVSRGIDRMMNGDRVIPRVGTQYGSQYRSYNTPVRRGFTTMVGGGDNLDRRGLVPTRMPEPRVARQSINTGIVVATKDEADAILEQMAILIDQYQVVTVGDLYNMAGIEASYVDEKWGWEDISTGSVQQIREGYLLDLPQPQPLQ